MKILGWVELVISLVSLLAAATGGPLWPINISFAILLGLLAAKNLLPKKARK